MNDRRVAKLFKQDEALSLDMNPIVIKKTTDFYVLTYKNFYMSCDIQGLVSFDDESLNEFCHFKVAKSAVELKYHLVSNDFTFEPFK
jgi:hypothetical protein